MDKTVILPFVQKPKTTLRDIIEASKTERYGIFNVDGDCMEGLKIMEGGKVKIDFQHYPRPNKKGNGIHDACLCCGLDIESDAQLFLKEYCGKWGAFHCVGTKYTKKKLKKVDMDKCFFAKQILGVVCASYDKEGNLLWEIDTGGFPEVLPQQSTIKGVNCEEPITIDEYKKNSPSIQQDTYGLSNQ